MRIIALMVLAAPLCPGQYKDLATTTDGSRLYFSSALRQRNTDQFLHAKIFLLDRAGLHLTAQVERVGTGFTNPYRLDSPDVSGDAAVLAYTATRDCSGGSSCFLGEQSFSTITFAATGERRDAGGHIRLSRNGRFAVAYNSANSMIYDVIRQDLVTGARSSLYPPIGRVVSGPTIAADGSVLNASSDRLVLYRQQAEVLKGGGVAAASMDDGVTTVVYESRSPRRLYAIELPSRREYQIGPDDRDSFQPVLNADGMWVLYLSQVGDAAQVFFSHPDGSGWRQLTDAWGGIREATLSGDGKVAYAVTGAGAILRISTDSGLVEQIIGPTPLVATVPGWQSPGSTYTITGSGLASFTAALLSPLPTEYWGITVRLGRTPAYLYRISPSEILYQVAWETPVNPQPAETKDTTVTLPGGDPYMEASYPIAISAVNPEAIPLDPDPIYPEPVAVHGDFSALVTLQNPALPGEILHLYLAGLGQVNPFVPSGVTTPLAPLSWAISSFQFTAEDSGGQRPLTVFFAGLAPALVGIYQLDIQLPSQISGDLINLHAKGWDRDWSLGTIPVRSR